MQTILGSGGAIGIELARALKKYTDKIRLVSRHPQKVNPTDEVMSADLLDAESVRKAVEGSDVVYVTVGFQYSVKTWKESWPKFITAVIQACEEFQCKMVFFDNIYMYDPNYLDGLTEEAPVKPCSRKGKIRVQIAKMIMDEVEAGKLKALIARSADFYGPGIKKTSVLTETVFTPLNTGKRAMWMGSVNFKHSYTYTPDAAKATAILGNTDDAYGQVWHLPTAANPFTGREWIEIIASELGVNAKYQVMPKFMLRLIGLFVPIMREMVEMIYQYDRNYIFNSDKFEKRFDYKPTPYIIGIREIIRSDYRK